MNWSVLPKIIKLKAYLFIAISSNDVDNYPQDGPIQMKAHAKEVGYPFPYLYDESQEIAKAYGRSLYT